MKQRVQGDWLTPEWPVPARVRALCSTRLGGVSRPPYDSLNLGDHVGDDPAAVARNRRIYSAMTRARPVFLQQVHGNGVLQIDRDTPDGVVADACIATGPEVACTVMVADCLPILLTDRSGSAVAAAHAGWRGLAGTAGMGIIEAAVSGFRTASGAADSGGAAMLAWLGPCIGPQAFEVGDEVRQAFAAHDPGTAAMFKPHGAGKWLADLPGLARLRLQSLGVEAVHGNDGSPHWCTVTNASRFFSHRRDRISGRFAASIWLA